jgi:hypothetical protein
MNWGKVLLYGAVALGMVVLLQFVVSLVFGLLSLLWTVVTTAVTLLALGGLLYGGYKLLSWIRGTGTESSDSVGEWDDDAPETEPADRVDALKERYTDGELSEDEFERRLEQELGGPSRDRLERERG